MATMYGRGKGKAGSHPPKKEKPYWLKLEAKEVEGLVVKLAKEGFDTAKIGLVLRDTYGVPSIKAATGKKIMNILKEHNLKTENLDFVNLEKQEKKIRKHIEHNKKDVTAKRGLQILQAKLHRLDRYYKRKQAKKNKK